MNILYLSISYNPKGKALYQSLVHTLVERGHKVTLVRSKPEISQTMLEELPQGYRLLSIKTPDPFSSNLIKKGMSQLALNVYFRSAIKKYLRNESFDLILYATPPVTLGGTIAWCKRHYGAHTFLMLKDIFPQNAVDLGMMSQNSWIYKLFRAKEKTYYRISDYIGCMSEGNRSYLLEHNTIDSQKVCLFPNSITIEEEATTQFNEDHTVFMFGGALGVPQNIPVLIEVARCLRDFPQAHFKVMGEGSDAHLIEEAIAYERLTNLEYHSTLPQVEYEQHLKQADVGLIVLNSKFTIPNIPSRFQTYLLLGKPVLALTDRATDLKNMIEDHKCGWWAPSDDVDAMCTTIRSICEDKPSQLNKGANGYNYLKQSFDVVDNVKLLENLFSRRAHH